MLTQEEELYYTLAGWTPYKFSVGTHFGCIVLNTKTGIIVNQCEVLYNYCDTDPIIGTLFKSTFWEDIPIEILDRLRNLVNG
jgi:hypothetical protein